MSNQTDVPVQVIVAAFQDEGAAKAAYKELKQAKKDHLISIENAAVIHKDKKGKIHIKEAHDMGGGKGAVIGAVAVGALALMFPVGILPAALLGGLGGGIFAKLRDTGFKNDRLKQIGDALEPETSALIAVVRHEWVGAVQEALQEEATNVMVAELSADIAQQLQEGGEVAYTAVATDEGVAAERVAVSDDAAEVTAIAASDEGVVVVDAVAEADEGEEAADTDNKDEA
jgi:uncharacterized membrane protein